MDRNPIHSRVSFALTEYHDIHLTILLVTDVDLRTLAIILGLCPDLVARLHQLQSMLRAAAFSRFGNLSIVTFEKLDGI